MNMSAPRCFQFSPVFVRGPEWLMFRLRLTVTVYCLHPIYADRQCLFTHTHTHTRTHTHAHTHTDTHARTCTHMHHSPLTAHSLMSSSRCTLVFSVSRLGYPVLPVDRRGQESSFHYTLRVQPRTTQTNLGWIYLNI